MWSDDNWMIEDGMHEAPRRRFVEPPVDRSRRLLVVEDDIDLETLIAHVVQRIDPRIELDWATSVSRAHELLGQYEYDLVVADYALTGSWTGLFLRHLCAHKYPWLPFVIMSGMPTQHYLAIAGDDPCPFLHKPFTVSECHDFLAAMMPTA